MATSLRLRRRLGEKKLPQNVNSLLAAGTTSGGGLGFVGLGFKLGIGIGAGLGSGLGMDKVGLGLG